MKEQLQKFSPEVVEELKHYVYRLIDPRNGQTFYVGKGKNNRVFAHAFDALSNYENQKYIDSENNEDDVSTKIKTVREIRAAGLEVIHIIHRFGLEENEAFEVESAVIDCFPGLTNLQSGHSSDRGVSNAITIEKELCKECYEEPKDIDYIIIKTSLERVEDSYGDLYEATRSAWKLSLNRAQNYKYVLSVINGIVKEVYEVTDWQKIEENGRIEFEGHVAEEKIRNLFFDKRIPPEYRKKGQANPALYKK